MKLAGGEGVAGRLAGWTVGNCDFNENPVVRLDLDFDLGFVNSLDFSILTSIGIRHTSWSIIGLTRDILFVIDYYLST